MVRALSLIALLLLAGCQVSRVPEESGTGPAELPRLRRASTALKEAIQLEKQHVAHFNEELRAIRERERSLAFEVEEAGSGSAAWPSRSRRPRPTTSACWATWGAWRATWPGSRASWPGPARPWVACRTS